MQAKSKLQYWLATIVFCSLVLAPTVFAAQSVSTVQFEQQMEMALRIWYAENPNSDLSGGVRLVTADGTGSITGSVYHGASPIEGAHIFAWAILSDMVVSQSAQTDAEGHYTLGNLQAGDYLVVASAAGYEPAFYGDAMSPLDAEPVNVVDDQVTEGIDIKLQESRRGQGTISGNVSADGPLAGAWVVAFGTTNPFAHGRTFAVSDENGDYKIDALMPGMYVLAAYANGYIPEVYDDATSLLDIDLITVNNDDQTGINFVLQVGGKISGTVTTEAGDPLAGVKVTAHAEDDFLPGVSVPGLANLIQSAITGEDGTYEIAGLATGDYKVSAQLRLRGFSDVEFYDNKDDLLDADPVSVTQGETTPDINLTFSLPTAKISGIVTDSQNNPLQDIYIYYVSEDAGYYQNFGRLWKSTMTDENGYYELPNLPEGTYYVSAWFWDWMNFNGVWYENADSLKNATPIPLADGETRDDINFTLDLTSDYGSISGKVTLDDSGDPVANAIVEAIAVEQTTTGPLRKRMPTMVGFTDADGNYAMSPVYKGDYYVRVLVNNYKEYFDDAVNRVDADTVTVMAGEDTPEINFGIPTLMNEGSSISGQVTDEDTGEPLENALVVVFPTIKHRWFNGDMSTWTRLYYTTATDAQGMYTVAGIPEGEYVVSSWARDYIAEFYDNARNPLRATVFELDGVEEVTDINIELALREGHCFACGTQNGRYGSIGGQIRSQNGMPVEGAFVFAVDGDENIVASEISGEDGSYALDGLDEGDYTVMVSRSLYETTYYPNVGGYDEATMLTVDADGNLNYSDATIVMHTEEITSVNSDVTAAPSEYELSQNYPNPFNPSTVIEYRVPEAANVKLQVFNIQGQLVKTLADKLQNAGSYKVTWNGTDMNGAVVPTGVYFYQIEANDFAQVRRLVFMR